MERHYLKHQKIEDLVQDPQFEQYMEPKYGDYKYIQAELDCLKGKLGAKDINKYGFSKNHVALG